MSAANNLTPDELRRRKRTIGIIAVAFLLLFTILSILRVITVIVWIFADLAVALIANLLLRRVGRVKL
jgi:hypothetical protein